MLRDLKLLVAQKNPGNIICGSQISTHFWTEPHSRLLMQAGNQLRIPRQTDFTLFDLNV